MVGTTRARVSKFMTGFRKKGFVRYNGGLQVNSALITGFLAKSTHVRCHESVDSARWLPLSAGNSSLTRHPKPAYAGHVRCAPQKGCVALDFRSALRLARTQGI